MADEIVVYNLYDDGTPTEAVAGQPNTSSGVVSATTPTSSVPSGSAASSITEGDVRNIIHNELAHYNGDIRVGALLSGQVFILDPEGLRIGGTNFADAPFSVTYDGHLVATSATITIATLGGFDIGADYIRDTANSFGLASTVTGGNDVRFWSGAAFASRTTAPYRLYEDGSFVATDGTFSGTVRTSVFEKDVVSAVGGQLLVANADVLDTAMTALDASTLTIKGETTFAVNDMLHLKDGTDEEYMRVTAIGSAPTYTVTRDLAGAYSANSNPAWSAGTAVVVEGKSDGASTYSGGFLKLLGSGTNSPKYSVFKRTGAAYNGITEYCTLGNLNGVLDYASEEYGIAIGTAALGYLAFDPTNGLRTTGKVISQQSFTTGIAIDAGSSAAIESDGLLYRTRATALSTKNTEQTLTTAVADPTSFANRLYSVSSGMRALFYNNGSNFLLKQIAISPTSSTITSVTSNTLDNTTTAAVGSDAVMVNSTDAVVCWGSGSAVRARYVQSIDATVTLGTSISIGAFAARPSVVKVSATEVLVIYQNGNDIKATSVSISGTTLTAGSTYTILANGNTNVPKFAERFGTSTAYCVYFTDTTNTKSYVMAFTFSGTTLTAGTPLEFQPAGFSAVSIGYLCNTTSSQMALFSNASNGAGGQRYEISTFNLSGTTLSLGVTSTIENFAGTTTTINFNVSLTKISNYTYALGYSDSTTTTVALLLRLVSNTFTILGSELTHTGITATTAIPNIFCYYSPTRALMVGTSSASPNGFAKTVDYTTNYSGTIGVITSAAAISTSALTILNGENTSVTGLTVGTEYYADLDGALTTAALGGTKRIGVANDTTKIIVQV